MKARFPSPPQERITLAAAITMGVLLIPMTLLLASNAAGEVGFRLGQIMGMSSRLRALVGLGGIAVIIGGAAGVTFLWIKARSHLTIEDGRIRYSRPGVPVFGWFAAARDMSVDAVDRIVVEKVRRGTVVRVELRIEAGRDAIAVNLSHADGEDFDGSATLLPRDAWLTHPLVSALEEATGKKAERL